MPLIRSPFKTKKAAKEAGYRTGEQWQSFHHGCKTPKRGATPVLVKGEEFYREQDCEEMLSATAAKKRGMRVRKNAVAVTEKRWERRTYPVFRISDCEPKQARQEIPPVDIDPLKAILAVNRAAKRYRDSSQSHYHNNQHGFCGSCEREETRPLLAKVPWHYCRLPCR